MEIGYVACYVEQEIKKAGRPKAYEAHQTNKEKLVHEIALDSGRDPSTVYTEIMHALQVNQHFKNIRRKQKRGEHYCVDRVDIETADGLQTKSKEGTKLWFEAIHDFEDNPLTKEWETEDYFEGWKGMSEDKSALSGVQAAHLKRIDPESKAADVVSWMALIPLLTGYAPEQQKKGQIS